MDLQENITATKRKVGVSNSYAYDSHWLEFALTTYCQAKCRSCARTNQDTGETYKLNFIELSIYDVILGAQSQMDMMGFSKDSIEISNTGLEWFQETNPEAYKILFQ